VSIFNSIKKLAPVTFSIRIDRVIAEEAGKTKPMLCGAPYHSVPHFDVPSASPSATKAELRELPLRLGFRNPIDRALSQQSRASQNISKSTSVILVIGCGFRLCFFELLKFSGQSLLQQLDRHPVFATTVPLRSGGQRGVQ
jgi:hypothetical protein